MLFENEERARKHGRFGRICKTCGELLGSAPDRDGEMLEWVCKTDGCLENGVVFARTAIRLDHVERFGQTPTNEIVLGKNLGGITPKEILHQVMQRNKDVIKIEKGRIIEDGNKFQMHTQEGRFALSTRRRQVSARENAREPQEYEERAIKLLSEWNEHLPLTLQLNNARIAQVATLVRKSVKKEAAKYGTLERKNLINIINVPLRNNNVPVIGQEIPA